QPLSAMKLNAKQSELLQLLLCQLLTAVSYAAVIDSSYDQVTSGSVDIGSYVSSGLLNATGLHTNSHCLMKCWATSCAVAIVKEAAILECRMLVINTASEPGLSNGSFVAREFQLEEGVQIWKARDFEQQVLRGTDSGRLLEYLAPRNVTHKRVHIPNNSVKIFAAFLQHQPAVSSLIGCVDKCSELLACRGIVFNSSNCSLLTDYPLCRWFEQPPNSSELAVYEFYTVGTRQCFETVNLRVSDALSFDRLWAEYKTGFGTYHSNYFAGLEWLHNRTSAQPSNNRFRVDLLYWNDTYIYAYYLNLLILAESTNYTVSNFTFAAAGGLGNCLFQGSNRQFVTRDRGWSECHNCAVRYEQPYWHGCCHNSGPFGKYFNYPTALNVSVADRAKGIQLLPAMKLNAKHSELLQLLLCQLITGHLACTYDRVTSGSINIGNYVSSGLLNEPGLHTNSHCLMKCWATSCAVAVVKEAAILKCWMLVINTGERQTNSDCIASYAVGDLTFIIENPLLTDYPLCRWFEQPPNSSELAVYEFHTVGTQQCFETVNLRVSDALNFDRLWAEYKTGFGTYHSNYFVEWLHNRTSAQPKNRFHVDLLYWNDAYIYAYYLNKTGCSENEKEKEISIEEWLRIEQFQRVKSRMKSTATGTRNRLVLLLQSDTHHGAIHQACDAATTAHEECVKLLSTQLLSAMKLNSKQSELLQLLLCQLLMAVSYAGVIDSSYDQVTSGSVDIGSYVSSGLLNATGLHTNSHCLMKCWATSCAVAIVKEAAILECRMLVINTASEPGLSNGSFIAREIRLEDGAQIWKARDFEQQVLRGTDSGRLLEYLAPRNVTHKRVHIPNNSVKIFAAFLQHQPAVSSLIGCVDKCSELLACRGIVFNSSNCSLLTDYPLCRWFEQPPNSSELTVYEFYTVGTRQCFETVNLRVSDALNFDRLWAEYKTGFGTYHSNYFAGLEWLHNRTSAQPNNNRFRVDLLYWNDTYIYAYYLNLLILAESTNYTVSNSTYAPAGGLGNCLFQGLNRQFVTRDRGWSNCHHNCAVKYEQPHWHGCCHNSGPFGKYFNYPTALNLPVFRASGCSGEALTPIPFSPGDPRQLVLRCHAWRSGAAGVRSGAWSSCPTGPDRTVTNLTYAPTGGLGDCMFHGVNRQFITRDRGWIDCQHNCAVRYAQPHWHKCCHSSGPFCKYFNYPTALNVPVVDRAKGIVWAANAQKNITDGWYYSFKQLQLLHAMNLNAEQAELLLLLLYQLLTLGSLMWHCAHYLLTPILVVATSANSAITARTYDRVTSDSISIGNYVSSKLLNGTGLHMNSHCLMKCSEMSSRNAIEPSLSNGSFVAREFRLEHGVKIWKARNFEQQEFYTVGTRQCFETVNLRVSDALNFDRLWAEYKTGFGTYHSNYFAGLEWLHNRTSAQPNNNRFRVDLLYWNDTYIYAYYLNLLILAESTNYTVSNSTYAPAGGLGNCLFQGLNRQFVTRDRGWSNCHHNCAVKYEQPHWHGCCHNSGPFGKYFNYPTALNLPVFRASGCSGEALTPIPFSPGDPRQLVLRCHAWRSGAAGVRSGAWSSCPTGPDRTVTNLTYAPTGGLGDCMFHGVNRQFITRDRGWIDCQHNCAVRYAQPHWHKCCHSSGPFCKYFNYPTALNVPVVDRAKGIVWAANAQKNITDGWYYSFKQLQLLHAMNLNAEQAELLLLLLYQLLTLGSLMWHCAHYLLTPILVVATSANSAITARTYDRVTSDSISIGNYIFASFLQHQPAASSLIGCVAKCSEVPACRGIVFNSSNCSLLTDYPLCRYSELAVYEFYTVGTKQCFETVNLRVSDALSFDRLWAEYKTGFGTYHGRLANWDDFIGLEWLHNRTSAQPNNIRFRNRNVTNIYAYYVNVLILAESTNYTKLFCSALVVQLMPLKTNQKAHSSDRPSSRAGAPLLSIIWAISKKLLALANSFAPEAIWKTEQPNAQMSDSLLYCTLSDSPAPSSSGAMKFRAEVDQLDSRVVSTNNYVRAVDVSVDHGRLPAVQVEQRAADLRAVGASRMHNAHLLAEVSNRQLIQRLVVDKPLQASAVQQLHEHNDCGGLRLSDVQEPDDVGMPQSAQVSLALDSSVDLCAHRGQLITELHRQSESLGSAGDTRVSSNFVDFAEASTADEANGTPGIGGGSGSQQSGGCGRIASTGRLVQATGCPYIHTGGVTQLHQLLPQSLITARAVLSCPHQRGTTLIVRQVATAAVRRSPQPRRVARLGQPLHFMSIRLLLQRRLASSEWPLSLARSDAVRPLRSFTSSSRNLFQFPCFMQKLNLGCLSRCSRCLAHFQLPVRAASISGMAPLSFRSHFASNDSSVSSHRWSRRAARCAAVSPFASAALGFAPSSNKYKMHFSVCTGVTGASATCMRTVRRAASALETSWRVASRRTWPKSPRMTSPTAEMPGKQEAALNQYPEAKTAAAAARADDEIEINRIEQLLSAAECSASSGETSQAELQAGEVSSSLKKLVKNSKNETLLRTRAEPLHDRLKQLNDGLKDDKRRRKSEAAAADASRGLTMEAENPFELSTAMQAQKQAEEAQLELMKSREAAMDQLAQDMIDLEEIFTELNKMVLEQGETINLIEDQVIHVVEDVEKGREQLEDAVRVKVSSPPEFFNSTMKLENRDFRAMMYLHFKQGKSPAESYQTLQNVFTHSSDMTHFVAHPNRSLADGTEVNSGRLESDGHLLISFRTDSRCSESATCGSISMTTTMKNLIFSLRQFEEPQNWLSQFGASVGASVVVGSVVGASVVVGSVVGASVVVGSVVGASVVVGSVVGASVVVGSVVGASVVVGSVVGASVVVGSVVGASVVVGSVVGASVVVGSVGGASVVVGSVIGASVVVGSVVGASVVVGSVVGASVVVGSVVGASVVIGSVVGASVVVGSVVGASVVVGSVVGASVVVGSVVGASVVVGSVVGASVVVGSVVGASVVVGSTDWAPEKCITEQSSDMTHFIAHSNRSLVDGTEVNSGRLESDGHLLISFRAGSRCSESATCGSISMAATTNSNTLAEAVQLLQIRLGQVIDAKTTILIKEKTRADRSHLAQKTVIVLHIGCLTGQPGEEGKVIGSCQKAGHKRVVVVVNMDEVARMASKICTLRVPTGAVGAVVGASVVVGSVVGASVVVGSVVGASVVVGSVVGASVVVGSSSDMAHFIAHSNRSLADGTEVNSGRLEWDGHLLISFRAGSCCSESATCGSVSMAARMLQNSLVCVSRISNSSVKAVEVREYFDSSSPAAADSSSRNATAIQLEQLPESAQLSTFHNPEIASLVYCNKLPCFGGNFAGLASDHVPCLDGPGRSVENSLVADLEGGAQSAMQRAPLIISSTFPRLGGPGQPQRQQGISDALGQHSQRPIEKLRIPANHVPAARMLRSQRLLVRVDNFVQPVRAEPKQVVKPVDTLATKRLSVGVPELRRGVLIAEVDGAGQRGLVGDGRPVEAGLDARHPNAELAQFATVAVAEGLRDGVGIQGAAIFNFSTTGNTEIRMFRVAVEHILLYGLEAVPITETRSAALDADCSRWAAASVAMLHTNTEFNDDQLPAKAILTDSLTCTANLEAQYGAAPGEANRPKMLEVFTSRPAGRRLISGRKDLRANINGKHLMKIVGAEELCRADPAAADASVVNHAPQAAQLAVFQRHFRLRYGRLHRLLVSDIHPNRDQILIAHGRELVHSGLGEAAGQDAPALASQTQGQLVTEAGVATEGHRELLSLLMSSYWGGLAREPDGALTMATVVRPALFHFFVVSSMTATSTAPFRAAAGGAVSAVILAKCRRGVRLLSLFVVSRAEVEIVVAAGASGDGVAASDCRCSSMVMVLQLEHVRFVRQLQLSALAVSIG
uniref:Fibrinogen C-terminal domain-containing protein n=1 Tax=Macrostomum lignano TaxID=282301 RepID=A0A1I8HZX2_9PLAT